MSSNGNDPPELPGPNNPGNDPASVPGPPPPVSHTSPYPPPQPHARSTLSPPPIQTRAAAGPTPLARQGSRYHLTQAQLSPAVGGTVSRGNPAHHPPLPPQPASPVDSQSGAQPSSATHKLTKSLQKLFVATNESDGRNLGFTPSTRMVASHEKAREANTAAEAPFQCQFQVTKLRSWRTGYLRVLRLYDNEFATLDVSKEPPTETNRWRYHSLTEWLAVPSNDPADATILLQVDNDKLKLSCHEVDRATVLTRLLRGQDQAGQANLHHSVLLDKVERYTRHGTAVPVQLQAKPYGLVEMDPNTHQTIQTYTYNTLVGMALTTDHSSGIVLYWKDLTPARSGATDAPTFVKSRLYLIHASRRPGGNGRSDLTTTLQSHLETLGLPFVMQSSTTVVQWLQARRAWRTGPVATTWAVTKRTRRHDSAIVGTSQGWVGGVVSRHLVVTGSGHVMERDGSGVVGARRLADLVCIVREPSGDELLLEFRDGTVRSYTSQQRDALIVSLLDAAHTLGENTAVYVSDVPRQAHCLSWLPVGFEASPTSGIFHNDAVPLFCLKRVYALSTQAYAYISRQFEALSTGQLEPVDVVHECRAVVEGCREFNASVPPSGEGLPTGEKDKTVVGTIGALWGLVSGLLVEDQAKTQETVAASGASRQRHVAEATAATLLQTLYRLSKSVTGYKSTAELSTFLETIPLLWTVSNEFCKYWALQVLNVLLSGVTPKRDLETEYINKNVIIKTGGVAIVRGIISSLVEPSKTMGSDGRQQLSDMLLMVASDILQSLLCSYNDTTSHDHFTAFIETLGEQ
ncbi:predicted protein [Phaeodactylum tricornutum CCAP 1055/1]|uniref:Cyclic nucleotide-binding domain-containing protein n=1 Tax=Phaeodactylum tricornutum (strain CCAP 1055/1) TaxID=556484 RepID=B7G010_PHATC|nr:predicted protein [Phaeodactylum tricornutum CCAP 1055/1]EEC47802.1 predicted protein [Phaeodactylum tricornutum CCAP 1055/1]|eukprot:XP_002180394.1 predicted protein [Phaeodactylum tricornutum CCAP 1055/1]